MPLDFALSCPMFFWGIFAGKLEFIHLIIVGMGNFLPLCGYQKGRRMPVSIITFACGGLEKIWKAQEASKIYISNFVCEENVLPTYTYTTLQNFKKLQRIQIQLGRYVRLRTNNLEKLSRFQKLPAYSELNIYNPAVQSILRRVKKFYIGIIFFHFPMCYYQSILITDRLALSSKVAGLTYTVIIQSIYIYLQYVKAKCLI